MTLHQHLTRLEGNPHVEHALETHHQVDKDFSSHVIYPFSFYFSSKSREKIDKNLTK